MRKRDTEREGDRERGNKGGGRDYRGKGRDREEWRQRREKERELEGESFQSSKDFPKNLKVMRKRYEFFILYKLISSPILFLKIKLNFDFILFIFNLN